MKRIINFVLLISCLCITAYGQGLEIVVTDFKAPDFKEKPAVTIKRSADYLVQAVRLINDSRSPERRKYEIIRTIENLLKASSKIEGIEVAYGDGFLTEVNLTNDSLQLILSKKRSDTNYLDIYVKVLLNSRRTTKQQVENLHRFINRIRLDRQTKLEMVGGIGVSIVDPEQYRYDILQEIDLENSRVQNLVADNCEFRIMGLESWVKWERSSLSELTLYIPYETDLTCK